MPGANCCIPGCGSCRRHKDLSIFKVKAPKTEAKKKWRAEILNIITKGREMDTQFRKQILNNSLRICEKHFEEKDFKRCKYSEKIVVLLLKV